MGRVDVLLVENHMSQLTICFVLSPLCHNIQNCFRWRLLCQPGCHNEGDVMWSRAAGNLDMQSQKKINLCCCKPLRFRVCFLQQHNLDSDWYTSLLIQKKITKKNLRFNLTVWEVKFLKREFLDTMQTIIYWAEFWRGFKNINFWIRET